MRGIVINVINCELFSENTPQWVLPKPNFTFYYAPFNQDISAWDVSNVKYMRNMFVAGYYQTIRFNQPIGNWDVGSVTDMSGMLRNSTFNQDISGWDVSNVTNME